MQLYCPNCRLSTAAAERCPHCGGRLVSPTELESVRGRRESSLLGAARKAEPPLIAPSPFGRVLVGTVAGLGLYLGLRESFLGLLVIVGGPELLEGAGGTLAGWTLRVAAVLAAGLLAGGGRGQAGLTGLAAGVMCAGAFHLLDVFSGLKATQWDAGAVPALAALAFPAGMVGGRLWPPTIVLPKPPPGSRGSSLLRKQTLLETKIPIRPTSWIRIAIGVVLLVASIAAADFLRSLIKTHLGHILQLGSPAMIPLVDCCLAMFGIMLAGVYASAGTGAGVRHGAIFGLFGTVAALVLLAVKPQFAELPLEGLLLLTGMEDNPRSGSGGMAVALLLFAGCTACGAFGGLLFPRLGKRRRRRSDD